MTRAKLLARRAKFMPDGIPRWIRVYDNGGETCDRYTVVYTGRYTHQTGGEHWLLAMSGAPFHPQGVGMHGTTKYACADAPNGKWPPAIGRKCHLGKRIAFQELPADCQKCALQDYEYLWDLTTAVHPMSIDPFAFVEVRA
jgi:hypothetical protein